MLDFIKQNNRRKAITEQCFNLQETGYFGVLDQNTKLPKYFKRAPSLFAQNVERSVMTWKHFQITSSKLIIYSTKSM